MGALYATSPTTGSHLSSSAGAAVKACEMCRCGGWAVDVGCRGCIKLTSGAMTPLDTLELAEDLDNGPASHPNLLRAALIDAYGHAPTSTSA